VFYGNQPYILPPQTKCVAGMDSCVTYTFTTNAARNSEFVNLCISSKLDYRLDYIVLMIDLNIVSLS
jgi:hypothetical protein